MEGWGHGWFWLFPLIGFTLMILLAVALVVFLIRGGGPRDTDPMRRAAARYAAGRIDRTEFERIQRDLLAAEAPRAPSPPETGAPPPA
jgi:uncharacterized membrane protein